MITIAAYQVNRAGGDVVASGSRMPRSTTSSASGASMIIPYVSARSVPSWVDCVVSTITRMITAIATATLRDGRRRSCTYGSRSASAKQVSFSVRNRLGQSLASRPRPIAISATDTTAVAATPVVRRPAVVARTGSTLPARAPPGTPRCCDPPGSLLHRAGSRPRAGGEPRSERPGDPRRRQPESLHAPVYAWRHGTKR